jgi:hypothetical protein
MNDFEIEQKLLKSFVSVVEMELRNERNKVTTKHYADMISVSGTRNWFSVRKLCCGWALHFCDFLRQDASLAHTMMNLFDKCIKRCSEFHFKNEKRVEAENKVVIPISKITDNEVLRIMLACALLSTKIEIDYNLYYPRKVSSGYIFHSLRSEYGGRMVKTLCEELSLVSSYESSVEDIHRTEREILKTLDYKLFDSPPSSLSFFHEIYEYALRGLTFNGVSHKTGDIYEDFYWDSRTLCNICLSSGEIHLWEYKQSWIALSMTILILIISDYFNTDSYSTITSRLNRLCKIVSLEPEIIFDIICTVKNLAEMYNNRSEIELENEWVSINNRSFVNLLEATEGDIMERIRSIASSSTHDESKESIYEKYSLTENSHMNYQPQPPLIPTGNSIHQLKWNLDDSLFWKELETKVLADSSMKSVKRQEVSPFSNIFSETYVDSISSNFFKSPITLQCSPAHTKRVTIDLTCDESIDEIPITPAKQTSKRKKSTKECSKMKRKIQTRSFYLKQQHSLKEGITVSSKKHKTR